MGTSRTPRKIRIGWGAAVVTAWILTLLWLAHVKASPRHRGTLYLTSIPEVGPVWAEGQDNPGPSVRWGCCDGYTHLGSAVYYDEGNGRSALKQTTFGSALAGKSIGAASGLLPPRSQNPRTTP